MFFTLHENIFNLSFSSKEKSREEIFEFLHYLEKMRDDEKLTMAEQEVEIRAHQEKAEAEKVAELKRLKGRRQQLQEVNSIGNASFRIKC